MLDNNLQYLIKLSEEIKNSSRNQRLAKTLIFIFLTSLIASLLFYGLNAIDQQFVHKITEYVPEAFLYLELLILSVFASLGCIKIYEWMRSFERFGKYSWDSQTVLHDWRFQGILRSDQARKALVLTDSDAGCILHRRSWKNFTFKFSFLIGNEHGFGVVFRAQDLENYLMFKVNPGQPISFHYRDSGSWQILKGSGPAVTLPIGKWVEGSLEVREQQAKLELNGTTIDYVLPNFAILNYVVSKDQQRVENPLVIPITHNRGSVGFRAFGDEELHFKDVTVERL
ncbi:MAG: hypothetical protein PHY34_00665 [Patescibacteria group bacterium]|nr:hypothetical protein [Patescibacteria group bacterium]MDD5715859.1 hypothetical protein [Patescibacteria group bacterium]